MGIQGAFYHRPTDQSAYSGGYVMLGLGDWGVSLAYLLSLGATLLCIVYGYINWNKPSQEEENREIAEEEAWEQEEIEGEVK